jgi:ABC-type branched-subunit amino acid transport system ATPase component/ABC-type branched-subunit amino acid transport system permease subunit
MTDAVSARSRLRVNSPRVFAIVVVALAAAPLIGEYQALVGVLAVVFGLVALGYVVLTGWTGQLSLGQVVPYGLGGYAVAFLADDANIPVAIAIPLAALAVVPAAALVGWAAERLRGLDLAIGTFALALTFQFLVFGSLSRALAPETAGSRSVVQVARPSLFALDLDTNRSFYLYALAVGLIAYVLVATLGRSATGRELLAVGDDPVRASVTGIQVGRLRILAFVVGGALAGLGGALLVSAREAATPETFTAFESLNLLALAVVGGLASTRGAIIGGVFGAVLPEVARVDPFRFLQGRLTLVYGIALVVVLIAKRGGLVALLDLDRRPQPDLAARSVAARAGSGDTARALLRVDDLVVDYGAARAVDGVTLRLDHGESVALVGPNGAGKSSVFDVVTGLIAPTSGRVYLDGTDITAHRPEQRAALGLGRTFQAARVFRSLSVGENMLAASHHAGHADAPAIAGELLDRLALRSAATARPDELPFGSLRLLEVGLALAGRPRLLLLDEPAAGLDAADVDRLAALLDEIRETSDVSVLVVDHDLGFVGRVADRVVVLDQGRVIADGTPRAVARDRLVREAFLGTASRELTTTRRKTSGRRTRTPRNRPQKREEVTRAAR